MPTTAIKNLAQKHGISITSAEKKWDEAKEIANKEYDDNDPAYWGTVMNITKSKIKKQAKKSKKKLKKESKIYNFGNFIKENINSKN